MAGKTVSIEFSPNGPIIVKGLRTLRNSKGDPLRTRPVLALCRCGSSKDKPFCDGSHKKVGFSEERENERPLDRERAYEGRQITINDNRVICSHAEACVKGLASVFRFGEKPWIEPDGAAADEIIAVIDRCPSGALSYTIDGVTHRDLDRPPAIRVARNGPYRVEGAIELQLSGDMQPPSREHFALCRCGASKNKPFCDGAHADIGFDDGS